MQESGSSFLDAQAEHQGQKRQSRILDCKPFITKYYSIGHTLKLKYFLFNFGSMLIGAAIQ